MSQSLDSCCFAAWILSGEIKQNKMLESFIFPFFFPSCLSWKVRCKIATSNPSWLFIGQCKKLSWLFQVCFMLINQTYWWRVKQLQERFSWAELSDALGTVAQALRRMTTVLAQPSAGLLGPFACFPMSCLVCSHVSKAVGMGHWHSLSCRQQVQVLPTQKMPGKHWQLTAVRSKRLLMPAITVGSRPPEVPRRWLLRKFSPKIPWRSNLVNCCNNCSASVSCLVWCTIIGKVRKL